MAHFAVGKKAHLRIKIIHCCMKSIYYTGCYILLLLAACACRQAGSGGDSALYDYDQIPRGPRQTFRIDNTVEYFLPALFSFVNKDGTTCLTFQNRLQSEILFYKMDEPDPVFRLKIEREGPNGVPGFFGYHIESMDEIYLTAPGRPQILRTDTSGIIRQKIDYGTTVDGQRMIPSFHSTSFAYSPLAIIGDQFFFTQTPLPGRPIETQPVSGYVDTAAHAVHTLPFSFPPILKDNELHTTGIGLEMTFSRCFNGSDFVYSFYFEENIIVASPDHLTIRRIPVKSKYIDRINDPREKRPADPLAAARRMCEAPFYGNLLHDPYRQLYYRIAYPETEMEPDADFIEIWQSGRKRFSLIILDHDFNILGETLFPDYIYKSTHLFVAPEGLYLCDSHVRNPSFSEDHLTFACFDFKIKK